MSALPKLIIRRSAMAAKIESTPYTFEPVGHEDYNLPVSEVSVTLTQENHEQKYVTRNMSTQEIVKGRQTVEITFSTPVKCSGVAGQATRDEKLLQACGNRIGSGAFGRVVVDDGSITSLPISIQFVTEFSGTDNWTGIRWSFRGCMGNVEEIVNAVGEPILRNYTISGAVEAVEDVAAGDMPMPTGLDSPIPLATKGTNLKFFNYIMNANTINVNQNNEIVVHSTFSAADGNEGAYRVDHNPGGTLDPYIAPEAEQFIYKRMTGETGVMVGSFEYRAGETGNLGNLYRVVVPRAQILQSHNPSDRDGAYAQNLEFRGLGNGETGMAPLIRVYGNPTGIAGYEAYNGT